MGKGVRIDRRTWGGFLRDRSPDGRVLWLGGRAHKEREQGREGDRVIADDRAQPPARHCRGSVGK
jgi:hypothetical protein